MTLYGDMDHWTLVQVMACRLTAPSHYLHQCGLPSSEVLWHSPESNFTASIILFNEFEHHPSKLEPHLPGTNELSMRIMDRCYGIYADVVTKQRGIDRPNTNADVNRYGIQSCIVLKITRRNSVFKVTGSNNVFKVTGSNIVFKVTGTESRILLSWVFIFNKCFVEI